MPTSALKCALRTFRASHQVSPVTDDWRLTPGARKGGIHERRIDAGRAGAPGLAGGGAGGRGGVGRRGRGGGCGGAGGGGRGANQAPGAWGSCWSPLERAYGDGAPAEAPRRLFLKM